MPRRARGAVAQPPAAPAMMLIGFLQVCSCLGSIAPSGSICVGCGCHAAFTDPHADECHMCDADAIPSMIECCACNLIWCNDACHAADNDGESFRYGKGSDGQPAAWCSECFEECKEARLAMGIAADADIEVQYHPVERGEGPAAGTLPPAKAARGRPKTKHMRVLGRQLPALKTECAKGVKCPNKCNMVSIENKTKLRDHYWGIRTGTIDGAKLAAYNFVFYFICRYV